MRYQASLTTAVVLVLLVSFGVNAATVWKWVDSKGVVHYSDQPVAGAVQVDLNVQTYESQGSAPTSTTQPAAKKTATEAQYTLLEIWKPTNDQTISGTGNQIAVSVRVEPTIQPGHSLRLELDGLRVSDPNSTATDFELKDIPRGAHTLSASVVTRNGQTLIQSSTVTFHMQQPTIIKPK